ncbi:MULTISPECIES: VanZ family protein [unclassified Sporosarcina]|uniref:VanZ family protein n=1 Tax=unclassified Sporosarcina TaxID=2647733 RepID=UPI000C167DB3|nr:VanZ family protein [Sporosarcina sp. P30]PID07842.1 VanZ family protein [Sporosarcina sp. P31]PID10847.1 VanZ family protein [Sporosarcina sp. P32b]
MFHLRKSYWKIIFGIYIVLLINFVVVKFNGNINHTINTVQMNIMRRAEGGSNYNLIPFQTVRMYLTDLSFSVAILNILGNIIPFIPMGFLIPMAFSSQRRMIKTMFTCFLLILSIECIQFFAYLGSFDVDDIILNTISCFLGFLFFSAYSRIYKKYKSA